MNPKLLVGFLALFVAQGYFIGENMLAVHDLKSGLIERVASLEMRTRNISYEYRCPDCNTVVFLNDFQRDLTCKSCGVRRQFVGITVPADLREAVTTIHQDGGGGACCCISSCDCVKPCRCADLKTTNKQAVEEFEATLNAIPGDGPKTNGGPSE